ncbi:MAG TPA: putative sulfate/molybdate transporter, partial [Bacillota bacterium]|nr:putative sulfate/molybdate transporter [Bacillota bacterium]
NLRELSGSMGDFGTLFPLAIGYIAVCGLNPAGLLVTMGLANIVTGIVYRLPMPIEPMKVLAVVAIAQAWPPSLIYASGFAMGLVWIIFAVTGVMDYVARYTPKAVIRGIQVALGVMLALEALKLLADWWLLGLVAVLIVIFLRQNRYAPAALVLVVLGLAIMYFRGDLAQVKAAGFNLPPLTAFKPLEVWQALLLAGFAQIPLTATNAVISTASLIKQYFPDRPVSERKLSLNMGLMNLVFPFFGGMPLCHGAGGLAGQYYFGARTGGANILEGTLEILLGVLLGTSIASLFALFPRAIIGAMMFLVGLEMVKFARDVKLNLDLAVLAVTTLVSILLNMAYGFLAGMAAHYIIVYIKNRHAKNSAAGG